MILKLSSVIVGGLARIEAGGMAASICNLHLVMVITPGTAEIKWWRVSPWLRQHDPEFKPDGTLVVLNNNIYMDAFGEGTGPGPLVSGLSVLHISSIMEIDSASDYIIGTRLWTSR